MSFEYEQVIEIFSYVVADQLQRMGVCVSQVGRDVGQGRALFAPEWAVRLFQCCGVEAGKRLIQRGLTDADFRNAVEALLIADDDLPTRWSLLARFVTMQGRFVEEAALERNNVRTDGLR